VSSYTVTPAVGTGGSISPATAQTINYGETTSFTLTPADDYAIGPVTGTCGGTLVGNIYTTNTITANCTVQASFMLLTVPQDLVVTSGHQVHLAWTAVPAATEYCVYVSEGSGITLANVASYDASLSTCTGTSDTLYTTTDLKHGTRYYFVVTAKADSNESAISAEVSVMPVSSPLNDTGIDWCANADINNLDCPVTGFLGQDADRGRDADTNLVKAGDGHAGFDFTKLDASGNALAASATEWSCVRDNHTGLTWEVKVNDDASLHHMDHTYTWYNPDTATNGGDAGTQNGGSCTGSDCDTHAFVQAVNSAELCGASDWRMPTRQELISIVHNGRIFPAINTGWFPNTPSDKFWSSSHPGYFTNAAYYVDFSHGGVVYIHKETGVRVRLVRAER
jgi:hypothetical protein